MIEFRRPRRHAGAVFIVYTMVDLLLRSDPRRATSPAKPPVHAMKLTRFAIVVPLLIATLAGCGWFDDPTPKEARLVIDGEPGDTAFILQSTKFVAAQTDQGRVRVELIQSDTFRVALPYTETINIVGDLQYFVLVTPPDSTGTPPVQMQVFIDDQLAFNAAGELGVNPFQFVYLFNRQLFSDDIELV